MLLCVVSFRKESVLITAAQYSAVYMQASTCLNRPCTLPALCVYVVWFFDTTLKHRSERRYSIFPWVSVHAFYCIVQYFIKNVCLTQPKLLPCSFISYMLHSLTFTPCIIRPIRTDQPYALIFNTPLFYVLAPTCFGSRLPSSGSLLHPSELREIQIEWVVYLKYITDKSISMYNIPCGTKQNERHNSNMMYSELKYGKNVQYRNMYKVEYK
jgi:hypothetical protein